MPNLRNEFYSSLKNEHDSGVKNNFPFMCLLQQEITPHTKLNIIVIIQQFKENTNTLPNEYH